MEKKCINYIDSDKMDSEQIESEKIDIEIIYLLNNKRRCNFDFKF